MKTRVRIRSLALIVAALCAGTSLAEERSEADTRRELDAARGELQALTRRIAELSAELGSSAGPQHFAFSFDAPKRAVIGVVLAPDEAGAKIQGVTPGGAAAKAGLKAGDVISAVNGAAMGKKAAAVDAVREAIGALEVGDTVTIDYLRDGKRASAKLTAERREVGEWLGMLEGVNPRIELKELPNIDRNIQVIINDGKGVEFAEKLEHLDHLEGLNIEGLDSLKSLSGDSLGERLHIISSGGLNLNLSKLNPELGRYFGADHGVLVLENGSDALKGLKAGDVIQIVDGQPADSVNGTMRLLGSKKKGEILVVEVMRDRKRLVLNIEAPEQNVLIFPRPPKPPAPPAPPAAPNAVPAPAAVPKPAAVPAPPAPPAPPAHRVEARAFAFTGTPTVEV